MEYYIYSNETNEHVATIVGDTNEACERAMENHYGSNDYSGTYSPAFGAVGGLVENPNAERILEKKTYAIENMGISQRR